MFRWEPKGHYRPRLCTAIAPFWFSTNHLYPVLTPFSLSTDELKSFVAKRNKRNFLHFKLRPPEYNTKLRISNDIPLLTYEGIFLKLWSTVSHNVLTVFLYISAVSIANISTWKKLRYCVLRRNYAVKVQRSLAPLSRFHGIHDNGPRDHELWRRTLTAYCLVKFKT